MKFQITSTKLQTSHKLQANASKRFWLFGFWILNLFVIWNLGFVIFTPKEAHAALISKPPTNLGLVGYWSMNEGTGTRAGDLSGKGNNGILTNGPTWVDGKRGKALSFDGVDDYVFVNDPGDSSVLDFDTSSTITMSAWIRKSSLTSYPLIVTKGRSNGSYTNYAIRSGDGTGSERKFSFFYRNSANTAWHVYDTVSNVFEVGNWYHVAVSYTFGTGSSIKMYINCVEMPGGWVAGTGNDAPLVGNFQLWIGDDNANSEFHGLIDEVRIYNRALSAT